MRTEVNREFHESIANGWIKNRWRCKLNYAVHNFLMTTKQVFRNILLDYTSTRKDWKLREKRIRFARVREPNETRRGSTIWRSIFRERLKFRSGLSVCPAGVAQWHSSLFLSRISRDPLPSTGNDHDVPVCSLSYYTKAAREKWRELRLRDHEGN